MQKQDAFEARISYFLDQKPFRRCLVETIRRRRLRGMRGQKRGPDESWSGGRLNQTVVEPEPESSDVVMQTGQVMED